MKKKDYSVLIMTIILLIVMLGFGGKEILDEGFHVFRDGSVFDIWFTFLNGRLGSNSAVILPIILSFGLAYSYHRYYHSAQYEQDVKEIGYINVEKRELVKGYKRGLILPGIMLVLFLIIMVSGASFTVANQTSSFYAMNVWGTNLLQNFFTVGVILGLQWLFTVFLVHLSYTLVPYFPHFSITWILTWMTVFLMEYAIHPVKSGIENLIGLYPTNIYELCMPQFIGSALLTMLFCLIVTTILYFVCTMLRYKKHRTEWPFE